MFLSAAWAAAVPKRQPNVILITIDTVRADHLGCYGYKEIRTPTIDGLARDGIVFERAISQVPLTWPSHAAILTGTYPFQNGVQDFTGQPLAPQFRSITQAFKQHGYATGAVVSAFVLDRSWGLARGFDYYDDAFGPQALATRDLGLVNRRAGESTTRAITWLKTKAPKPFFLWLHLYDPHSPYDPPQPFRGQYQNHPYDGEIAYADSELGRLIAWLKTNQLYQKTAIALLSDHGESLGEHGEQEHGYFLYNSTVHIPMIVKPPAGQGIRPGRISTTVETTSLAPTLLGLAGVKDEIETQFQSRTLLDPALKQQDAAYSETFYPFSSFGWSPLHSLETGHYHYIDAPQPELYDLAADPGEKNNLAADQGATTAVLKDKLQVLLRQNPFKPPADANVQLNADSLERLRALGYVAYRSPVSAEALATGLPDPKSKLSEFNAILEAADAFRANNFSAGRALLSEVEKKDPGMYVAAFMLAEAWARQEKWDEATAAFQRCLKANPDFDQAMTGLAHALFKQGDSEGATAWVEKAIAHNPQNYRAWYELGALQSKMNSPSAESAYEKSVSIQPNFALGWRELGVLQARQQKYDVAAKSLSTAIELGVNDPKVFNFLGIAYSHTNRQAKAIETYREAIKMDPQLAEAHLNLAYSYEQLHQTTLSRKEYQEACRLRDEFCHVMKRQN
jgi:arylsulfatase A-like enzyme/Tfp pilus assembly protein PilF